MYFTHSTAQVESTSTELPSVPSSSSSSSLQRGMDDISLSQQPEDTEVEDTNNEGTLSLISVIHQHKCCEYISELERISFTDPPKPQQLDLMIYGDSLTGTAILHDIDNFNLIERYLSYIMIQSTGKSSILARYLNETVKESGYGWHGHLTAYTPKMVLSNGAEVVWELSDCSNDRVYMNYLTLELRCKHAFVLCYDITNSESLSNLKRWHTNIMNVSYHLHLDIFTLIISHLDLS